MFTDTHCHLYYEYYNNINDVIEESISHGVNRFFNCGVNNKSNKEVLELSKTYDNVFCAIGIHPEYANNYTDEDIKFIKTHIKNNKVIAIGEIGLDYHYLDVNKEKQKELFIKQLEIAQEFNIPVIIHNRKATDDILKILSKYNLKGIIHCFNRSEEIAKQFIEKGMLLGINGVSTYDNSKSISMIKNIPLSSFVLETDSPYLTPEPHRGEKNEPKHINDLAFFISRTRNISISELSFQTNQNILKMFNI